VQGKITPVIAIWIFFTVCMILSTPNNPGWEAVGRIEEIRGVISKALELDIDLANRDSLNRVSEKYILGETVYVA
jgi:hypothetical protein